jgi:hypothetical protein
MIKFTAANMNNITEIVVANNGHIVDDHRDTGTLKIAGVALLLKAGQDEGFVVALCDSKYFSLNRMYIKEGKVHVSRDSVAGAVVPMKYENSLTQAIDAFNAEQLDNRFTNGSLTNVVLF